MSPRLSRRIYESGIPLVALTHLTAFDRLRVRHAFNAGVRKLVGVTCQGVTSCAAAVPIAVVLDSSMTTLASALAVKSRSGHWSQQLVTPDRDSRRVVHGHVSVTASPNGRR